MGINSLYVRSSKKWICKTCDLSFKNSLGRLYHLRSHHSEFLKHCCHECGLKCETESAVQSHIQRKHRKQSKAKNKDSLLDLQKLRRRSKCMYCDTRFLNEFLHIQHVQMTHQKASLSFNTSAKQASAGGSQPTSATIPPKQKWGDFSQDSVGFVSTSSVPKEKTKFAIPANSIGVFKLNQNMDSNKISLKYRAKVEEACLKYALLHGKHEAQLHFAKLEPGCRIGWRRITELLKNNVDVQRDFTNYNKKSGKSIPHNIASDCGRYGVAYGIDEAQWEFTLRYPDYVFSYNSVWNWSSVEGKRLACIAEKSEEDFNEKCVLLFNKILSGNKPKSINAVAHTIIKVVTKYNENISVDEQILSENVLDELMHTINDFVAGKCQPEHTRINSVKNKQNHNHAVLLHKKVTKKRPTIKEFIVSLDEVLRTKKLSLRDTEKTIKSHVSSFNEDIPLPQRISLQNILEEWLHFINFKAASNKVGIKSMPKDTSFITQDVTLHPKRSETTKPVPTMKEFIVSLNHILNRKKLSVKETEKMIKNHVQKFNNQVSCESQISYKNILAEWLHFLNFKAFEIKAKNKALELAKSSMNPRKRRKLRSLSTKSGSKIENNHRKNPSLSTLRNAPVVFEKFVYPDLIYPSIIVEERVPKVNWDVLIEEEEEEENGFFILDQAVSSLT